MVSLYPFWHSANYFTQLGALRKAYETSNHELDAASETTSTAVSDHIGRLKADVDTDDADDGLGNYVSKRLLLKIKHESVVAAQVALRKSMITAVYHFWERSVQRWIAFGGRGHAKHSDFIELARRAGVTGDLDALRPWHYINNALKHDNPEWISKLEAEGYSRFVEYYYDLDMTIKPQPYDLIVVSHDDLIGLFDLMTTLGPDSMNGWPDILEPYVNWEPDGL